ncbi:ATPase, T2SS/T4P/T4SS family [Burkholderia cenocepacia]|uniref:ATPase, T2SS/T4P/T4SS family n=1 Tax=Burkholderia cenocepacia TaxID=95486 RepID=UPI002654F907|nr:ATPase, T2SS/T4P/T4SS family [Burkholderia cenocepacia]MDN7452307.1 ATPase, T2SS/T4P/T4SS family [Burkholderia cenocepacia]
MLKLEVQGRKEAPQTVLVEHACSIGKAADCDVVVKGMLVGKLQARIVARDNAWYLEDQGGIAATLVNGDPVTTYGPLTTADEIEIGTTTIKVLSATQSRTAAKEPARASEPLREAPAARAAPAGPPREGEAAAADASHPAQAGTANPASRPQYLPSAPRPPESPESPNSPDAPDAPESLASRGSPAPVVARAAPVPRPPGATPAPPARASIDGRKGIELRKKAHMQLIARLDLRRLNVARMDDGELRRTVGDALDEILRGDASFRWPDVSLDELRKSVFDEVIGLGPLEELIDDPEVSEIMVNCHDEIFIERSGKLMRSPVIFTDDRAVLGAIERIVAPIGRRIDESSPMVDARLSDGSRVNAVIPPLALKGPSITIRKFSKRKLTGEDLVDFGSMSPEMLAFLRTAVEQRANIIISGGTGSGKTTLLNVLSSYIPDDERIVTVEDAAELQLSQPNLVSLEARPPNMEGKGAVPIRELVKNCLRMRPDRIVVGECRGGEALDMLQAMNTGHDGSLTTAHANTPRDCIARLEVMTLMAGLDLPVQAIREQVCSAVDIIVQQTRFSCGSRRVTYVTEVSGMESGVIQLQDVFVFRQDGFGADGKVRGEFRATAYIPDFYQDLLRRHVSVDTSIFTAGGIEPVQP